MNALPNFLSFWSGLFSEKLDSDGPWTVILANGKRRKFDAEPEAYRCAAYQALYGSGKMIRSGRTFIVQPAEKQ